MTSDEIKAEMLAEHARVEAAVAAEEARALREQAPLDFDGSDA